MTSKIFHNVICHIYMIHLVAIFKSVIYRMLRAMPHRQMQQTEDMTW